MDLRGHGLSDAPTEPDAYDLEVLATDVIAVAEGSGVLDDGPVVLAGHGFGAIVAAAAAARLGRGAAGWSSSTAGWSRSRRQPARTSTSSCAASRSRPR